MNISITKNNICKIACVLIAVSTFLPFVSLSIFGTNLSRSLMDGGDGPIFLAIAIIAYIFVMREKYIPSTILGLVSVGLFIFEKINLSSKIDTTDKLAKSILRNDFGFYMLLVGSVALVVYSIFALK